jgi:alpha-mannosidase
MEVVYSTPNDYIKDVMAEDVEFPTYGDDFLPYADDGESYWTGYYASRPNLKGAV